jgi:hypothetical protein
MEFSIGDIIQTSVFDETLCNMIYNSWIIPIFLTQCWYEPDFIMLIISAWMLMKGSILNIKFSVRILVLSLIIPFVTTNNILFYIYTASELLYFIIYCIIMYNTFEYNLTEADQYQIFKIYNICSGTARDMFRHFGVRAVPSMYKFKSMGDVLVTSNDIFNAKVQMFNNYCIMYIPCGFYFIMSPMLFTFVPFKRISSTDECPVCKDTVCDIQFCCTHSVCAECASKFLPRSCLCPICRINLSSGEHIPMLIGAISIERLIVDGNDRTVVDTMEEIVETTDDITL